MEQELGKIISLLSKCEAVDKKCKRTAIAPDVKDWFLDYHGCMKVKHKWNMRQSWRRARDVAELAWKRH